MQQQPRHLAGAIEDERVGAGHMRLEKTESAGVDLRVQAQLRHVAAHQGEIVGLVQTAQTPNPLDRCLVTDLAPQCVGRVGRIDDHTALTDDFHRLANQPRLGVLRMNLEKLAHEVFLFISP
ncbi:hypothetical protein D3C73_1128310 [compost metagenome]